MFRLLPALIVFSIVPVAVAETIVVAVQVPAITPAFQVSEGPMWNEAQLVAGAGGSMREAVPLLVLLPPDVVGHPQVSVQRAGCLPSPPVTGEHVLRELTGGRIVKPVGPVPQDVQAYPLMFEGDALLLPVLVDVHKAGDDGVLRCTEIEVAVSVTRSGAPIPEHGHFSPRRLVTAAVNAADYSGWYSPYAGQRATYDYLIITRAAFQGISEQLEAFVEFKESQGFSPLVITIEQISEQVGNPDIPVPELIRGWLQQNYKALGFKYLLLLGSPRTDSEDSVPMKTCWPAKGYEDPAMGYEDVPTDLYYGDMTGNWNPDNDEYWCELEDYMEIPEEGQEPTDDSRLDGVDLAVELLVARIPHFGLQPAYADEILERLMAYQQVKPETWHNRVLLPSPMIAFPDGGYVDGSEVSQFLIDHSLAQNGFGATVLGEWEGKLKSKIPGVAALTGETLPDHWNEGYGAVFWCAHGNEDGAYRNVWNQDFNTNGLPEQEECEHPAFIASKSYSVLTGGRDPVVFMASCLTANPDVDGNLAHSLIHHAAVGVVGSSRITMGLDPEPAGWTPSPYSGGAFTLGVYFTHAVTAKRLALADAFRYSHGTLGLGVQPWTMKIRLEFNLYGDPSLRLPGCDEDSDCKDDDVCNGLESCQEGRCVSEPGPACLVPPEPTGECRTYLCDPLAGCVFDLVLDGTLCDDGLPCTLPGTCTQGTCSPGSPQKCDAGGMPCWHGACDPDQDTCLLEPDEDGMLCLLDGVSGSCTGGSCIVDSTLPDAESTGDSISQADGIEVFGPGGQPSSSDSGSRFLGCTHTNRGQFPSVMVVFLLLLVICYRRMYRRVDKRGNLFHASTAGQSLRPG